MNTHLFGAHTLKYGVQLLKIQDNELRQWKDGNGYTPSPAQLPIMGP